MRISGAASRRFATKWLLAGLVVCYSILMSGDVIVQTYFDHHSVWAPQYQLKSGIKLYGSFNLATIAQVEELLSVLPRKMVNSIDSIKINDDKKHYRRGDIAHFNSRCGGRRICLQSNRINAMWHEAAHAYESYLDSCGSDFIKQWRVVAGDVYGDNSRSFRVGDGLLTAYSRTSYREDVAEFVEAFYCVISGEPSALRVLYAARLKDFADGKPWRLDPRYQKKIDLLLKYGFVSRADYDKFMDLGYLDPQSGSPLARFVLPKPKDKAGSRGIFVFCVGE